MTVLNTIRYGNPLGPPLLAIHGITGHAKRWARLATERWQERDVLAVDLRGHGFSTWDPPWSMPQLVADVLDTLDDLGHAAVDVLGQSYGGMVALHLLDVAPERVRRVVLLDPSIVREADVMAREAEWLMGTDGWATRDEAVRHRNSGFGDTIHPGVADEVAHHLVEGDDGRFRYRYSRPMVVTAFGEMAAPLPALRTSRPTLLVAAERPRIVRPDVSATLRERLGHDYHEVSIDCGHMVLWERFDETAAFVEEFLR